MRIAIAGAGGRMGQALIESVLKSGGFELAAAFDVPGSALVGRDAGERFGAPCGVKVTADPAAAVARADCLIDFTRPEGTLAHLDLCMKAGTRMVIGTTGISAAQRQRIEAAAQKIAIVFAPNMSVGVNVVFSLAETAARALGEDYDVEIIEAHHRGKVDAPSGTALRLGEIVARSRGRSLADSAVHGRKGETGARQRGSIGFHAVRGGDIVGEHTVMFAGEGERVEIAVRSGSRATYAAGALRACRFLGDKAAGLYDMQDVLGLR